MLIQVKVHPDAKKEQIKEKDSQHLEIWTKAKAKHGEANKVLRKKIANHFNVLPKKISLEKGFRQPNKIFKIYK